MNLEDICKDVKEILSEHRYNHSIGVMEMAGTLAKIYNVDEQKAKITGILHDIAKEMTKEESYKYITENSISIDEIEKMQYKILHGKIGADICKKKYKLDEEMQEAIRFHTTGVPNMGILSKIIFVSDKIEKNRTYEGVEELRIIAKKDIDLAIIKILENEIIKNIKKGTIIHPNTLNTRNFLLMK